MIYAKIKNEEDFIWEITCDNEDGTVDINMDDIQGDITICFFPMSDLIIVSEQEYLDRIKELTTSP